MQLNDKYKYSKIKNLYSYMFTFTNMVKIFTTSVKNY